MKRLAALALLGFNFFKDVVASGWATALVILFRHKALQPGFVRMSYGDLPESAANFLGALVTLTPGTTTIDIDVERREFLLHVLDMTRVETTLASIRRDFIAPVRTLFGGET